MHFYCIEFLSVVTPLHTSNFLFLVELRAGMPHLRVILFIVLIVVSMLLYYMSRRTPTTIIELIVKSSTLTYKVIVMDERRPSYKLATVDGKKPDVNGDRAQATVVKHLQLVEKCRHDPSLIVVDVGAFLGRKGL